MKSRHKNTCYVRYSVIFSMLFTFIFSSAFAQQEGAAPEVREDFSDDELSSFVDAYEGVMLIQQESEQKMLDAIESEDLTMERFNEVLAMQQDPSKEVDATADEMASFNNAAQAIIKERQDAETKVISVIEGEGLDIETYQEIMMAYQYSPVVQEKLNKLLEP